jgi:hypothetical protein
MQIDPAALSRTDSASNPAKSATPNAQSTVKSSRALISVPRLDLEHSYTDLKAAIGDKWAEYKEATALFLLGMTYPAAVTSDIPDFTIQLLSISNRWKYVALRSS